MFLFTFFEVWKCSHSVECFVFLVIRSIFSMFSRRNRFDHRLSRIRWRVWIAAIFSWQKRISRLDVSRRNHLKAWLNSSFVYLFTFSFWIHRISNTSAVYVASFVLMICKDNLKDSRRQFCTNNFVNRFSLFWFERCWRSRIALWI